MSGTTYTKAKAVVAAAESNPADYGDLVTQMDSGGASSPGRDLTPELFGTRAPAQPPEDASAAGARAEEPITPDARFLRLPSVQQLPWQIRAQRRPQPRTRTTPPTFTPGRFAAQTRERPR